MWNQGNYLRVRPLCHGTFFNRPGPRSGTDYMRVGYVTDSSLYASNWRLRTSDSINKAKIFRWQYFSYRTCCLLLIGLMTRIQLIHAVSELLGIRRWTDCRHLWLAFYVCLMPTRKNRPMQWTTPPAQLLRQAWCLHLNQLYTLTLELINL